jgi:DNA-binding NtrC family response regulator
VLVLEDDPAVRATTARVFKEAGYRVVAAASGEHASDAWRAHPGRFALLVADLVLPGTRSGMEWAENFVRESPGSRVLLTSGYSLEQIGLRLEPRLGWAFLPKPYPMDRLLEIVDRLLRPTPARAEPANTDAGALKA